MNVYASTKVDIREFGNLSEMRAWAAANPPSRNVKDVVVGTPHEFNSTLARGWYGTHIKNANQLTVPVAQYSKMPLIDKLEQEIEEKMRQDYLLKGQDSGGEIPKRKMKFNDRGMGLFSFDAAAAGFYRLPEYYSDVHQRVVDEREVAQVKPEHYELISDRTEVIRRLEQRADGRPKVRTSNKRIFTHIDRNKRAAAKLEIYISAGQNGWVEADDFLYSGSAAIILAKRMIAASIPVRINIVMGEHDSTHNRYTCIVIPIKDYDEPLDINLIALTSSEPSFIRYESFLTKYQSKELFYRYPVRIGRTVSAEELKFLFEKERYRTDVPNRLYMGAVTSKTEAIAQVSTTMDKVKKSLGL